MDSRGQFLVAIFFALLAVAFTGGEREGIGFSKECIEGIDNDGDGQNDAQDVDCRSYPYADGLGETFTPIGADYQGDYYSVSMFDYLLDYDPAWNPSDFCQPYEVSGDPGSIMQSFLALETYSNGKDTAADDYLYWYNQNCP